MYVFVTSGRINFNEYPEFTERIPWSSSSQMSGRPARIDGFQTTVLYCLRYVVSQVSHATTNQVRFRGKRSSY